MIGGKVGGRFKIKSLVGGNSATVVFSYSQLDFPTIEGNFLYFVVRGFFFFPE